MIYYDDNNNYYYLPSIKLYYVLDLYALSNLIIQSLFQVGIVILIHLLMNSLRLREVKSLAQCAQNNSWVLSACPESNFLGTALFKKKLLHGAATGHFLDITCE